MICPADNTKLKCVDTRQREGYVSRTYKCLKCGGRFYSAELLRDEGTPGRQLNISGEAFSKQQIIDAKQRIVDKLKAAIASIMDD